MKLTTIPPGLAGKIVKYRPLSQPIRLQDLEDSARSQAWKKRIKIVTLPSSLFQFTDQLFPKQKRTIIF